MRRILDELRNRRRAGGGDVGMTLTEMVVSMAIGSLLLLCVTALTVNQLRAVDGAEKRSTTSNQTANALDLTSKQLRTAMSPAAGVRAFISASGEEVGFYTNLESLNGATTDAQKRVAYTPEEVWIWTQTVNGKRQLCDQVRRLTRDGTGALVVPATPSLTGVASRTCHVLVADLATPDTTPTFVYLDDIDPIGTDGLSTSSIALNAAGAVVDTRSIDGVQIRIRANSGTARDQSTVTSVTRVSLVNSIS